MTASIRPLAAIAEIQPLRPPSLAEGWRMVERMIDAWTEGANRFDRPGEAAFVAVVDETVAGVCGLNVDPYAADESVGRVRHLYVAPEHRRQGIGAALTRAVTRHAEGRFRVLRLRTRNPNAKTFYESLGFTPVAGDEFCTHHLPLPR